MLRMNGKYNETALLISGDSLAWKGQENIGEKVFLTGEFHQKEDRRKSFAENVMSEQWV